MMNNIKYIDRLVLFEALRKDEIVSRLSDLNSTGCLDLCSVSCAELSDDASARPPEDAVREAYYAVQRRIFDNVGQGGITGNYLQDYLCQKIAVEDNVFARMSEKGAFEKLRPGMAMSEIEPLIDEEALFIISLAAREIKHLAPIYRFSFSDVTDTGDGRDIAAFAANPQAPATSAQAQTPATSAQAQAQAPAHSIPSPREHIHQAMMQDKILDAAILLSGYYRSYGAGMFGAASAFSAEKRGLVPIRQADPVTMDDIIGCESQKKALSDNIEILLAGYSANNMLLYGDSGTGKSSSAKALLNKYAARGLKLISVPKDRLGRLPYIFGKIADRGMKFIIFIDDLSFEENEHEFKAFKSIIEGRVAPRPKNAVFIVTTNRKNIVKETWADREGQDDVRPHDNMQEKRSLSDRFGITLLYPAPDKSEYLAIVRGIADGAGLEMDKEKLEAEALKWEIRHSGRSGRTARQLVDYMAGLEQLKHGKAGA